MSSTKRLLTVLALVAIMLAWPQRTGFNGQVLAPESPNRSADLGSLQVTNSLEDSRNTLSVEPSSQKTLISGDIVQQKPCNIQASDETQNYDGMTDQGNSEASPTETAPQPNDTVVNPAPEPEPEPYIPSGSLCGRCGQPSDAAKKQGILCPQYCMQMM